MARRNAKMIGGWMMKFSPLKMSLLTKVSMRSWKNVACATHQCNEGMKNFQPAEILALRSKV